MKTEGVYKAKSKSEMESDHIVLVDDNKKEIELFWFVHEVIIFLKDGNNFVFTKEFETYKILSALASQLKEVNKIAGGDFVKDNKFTWHHMARAWDKPFEENAGFTASMNNDNIEVNFFPSKQKSFRDGFISMGGPDGYIEPYQSVSDLFANVLNEMLNKVPYKTETNSEKI